MQALPWLFAWLVSNAKFGLRITEPENGLIVPSDEELPCKIQYVAEDLDQVRAHLRGASICFGLDTEWLVCSQQVFTATPTLHGLESGTRTFSTWLQNDSIPRTPQEAKQSTGTLHYQESTFTVLELGETPPMKQKLDTPTHDSTSPVVCFDEACTVADVNTNFGPKLSKQQRSKFFDDVYNYGVWDGSSQNAEHNSRSGIGSAISNTRDARIALAEVFRSFGITRMLDIPCGDFNW